MNTSKTPAIFHFHHRLKRRFGNMPGWLISAVPLATVAFLALGLVSCRKRDVTKKQGQSTAPASESKAGKGRNQDSPLLAAAYPQESRRWHILDQSLTKVVQRYVEPSKVDLPSMAIDALLQLQEEVASVQVKVLKRPNRNQRLDGLVEITVAGNRARFALPADMTRRGTVAFLGKVLDFVRRNLAQMKNGDDTKPSDLQYTVISGVLSKLDPYSILLKPDDFGEMQIRTKGSFGGIGIVISIRDGALTVITPIDGTPAAKAGIQPGDRIVRIGDESTVNMPLHEAVDRLRGKIGTLVTFWVERKGLAAPKKFVLIRAKIEIHSVRSKMLPGKIGYVRLSRFSENTRPELAKAITKLSHAGAQSLILDLTNNPGGLLSQAVAVVDAFVDQGIIVSTKGASGLLYEKWTATPERTLWRKPLVVLANRGSASAAEIVAGALKHLGRGVLLGERTFGKGSVQVLLRNDDGSAIKLTVARYLVRGDVPIQTVGVTPDLELTPVILRKDWIYFDDPVGRTSERRLRSHLSAGAKVHFEQPRWTMSYLLEKRRNAKIRWHSDGESGASGPVLHLARTLLGQTPGPRDAMLKTMGPFVETQAKAQALRIAVAARRLGVNFSAPPRSPTARPTLSHRLLFSPKSGKVEAGKKITITLEVKNEGTDQAWQVRGILRAPEYYLNGKQFLLGTIPPGGTRTWTVEASIPEYEWSQAVPLRVDVLAAGMSVQTKDLDRDPREEVIVSPEAFVHVQQRARPAMVLTYAARELQGNGDGRLSVGERVQIHCTLADKGPGPLKNAVVTLTNETGKAVYLEKGRAVIKTLAEGKSAQADVTFRLQSQPKKKMLNFTLGAYHAATRTGFEEHLDIPLNQPLASVSGRLETPHITITGSLPQITSRSVVHLQGQATHPDGLVDLYVFVSNSRGQGYRRKVFYASAKAGTKQTEIPFSTDIDLPVGANTIIVMARRSDKLSSYKLLRVFRRDNHATAPRAHQGRGQPSARVMGDARPARP